ncbi:hypothetical protein NDA16_004342 [Ustilago loliicola]|nr:hypothetical protein NDA16_004342 [Ustilago loliicola]
MTTDFAADMLFKQALLSHMASAHPGMLPQKINFNTTNHSTSQAESLARAKRDQAESVGKHYLSTIPLVPSVNEALATLPTHLPTLNLAALTPRQATEHDLLKWRWTAHKTRQLRIELQQYDDDIAGRKEAITKFGEMMLIALFGQNWTAAPKLKCSPSYVYMPDDADDDPYGYGSGYGYGYGYDAWGSGRHRKHSEEPFVHPSKPPAGTKLDSYDPREGDTLRLSDAALKLVRKSPQDVKAKTTNKDGDPGSEDCSDSDEISYDDPTDWHTNNPYFFDPYIEPDDIDYGLDYDEYDPEYGYYDGYAEEHSDAYNEAMFDALYAKAWGDSRPLDAMFGGRMGSSGSGMRKGKKLGKKQGKVKGKGKKIQKGTFADASNSFTPYEENGWTVIYDANKANGEGGGGKASGGAKEKAASTSSKLPQANTSTPQKKGALSNPSTPKKPATTTLAKQLNLTPSLSQTPTSITSVGLGLASSPSSLTPLPTLPVKPLSSTTVHTMSNGKHTLSSNANLSSNPSPSSSVTFPPPVQPSASIALSKPNLGKRKATESSSSTEAGRLKTSSKPMTNKPVPVSSTSAGGGKGEGAKAKPMPASLGDAALEEGDDEKEASAKNQNEKASAEGKKDKPRGEGKTDKQKKEAKAAQDKAKGKGVKPKQPKIKYEVVVFKKPYMPSKRPWRDCWHRRGHV